MCGRRTARWCRALASSLWRWSCAASGWVRFSAAERMERPAALFGGGSVPASAWAASKLAQPCSLLCTNVQAPRSATSGRHWRRRGSASQAWTLGALPVCYCLIV